MIEIVLDFKKDQALLFEILKAKLSLNSYFSYNLDSLYDLLLDYDNNLLIIIKNHNKNIKLYDLFSDIIKINKKIKIEIKD